MQELADVSMQQNALLGELSAIESELDQLLPQFMGSSQKSGAKENKFLKSMMSNPDIYATASNREKVFDEALNLEQNIRKLDRELISVNE